jgi:class 3 adenylate cyclase
MAASSPSHGWFQNKDSPLLGLPLGFLVAGVLWFLVVIFPGFFLNLELQAERLMLQRRGVEDRRPGEPPVVLVTQDDNTYEWVEAKLGQAPGEWSREIYATLLRRLRMLGARVVGFDFLFDSDKEGTGAFAKALAERKDSVLAAAWQQQISQHGERRVYLNKFVRPTSDLEKASRIGGIRVPLDQDELVRRYFLDVTLPDKSALPSLAREVAVLARPEITKEFTTLPVDFQRSFALDFRAPSPAFEEIELYRLLDPERFFELTWRRIFPVEGFSNLRVEVPEVGTEKGRIEVVVEPPGLEVEILAVPLAMGPWSRAKGRGRLVLEGLASIPHAIYVARTLGEGSWGIFSMDRVQSDQSPVRVTFPALKKGLTLRLEGKPPAGLIVDLTGQGISLGEGTYRELLRASPQADGSYATPPAVEPDFWVTAAGKELGVLSRGGEIPVFSAPTEVPARSEGRLLLEGAKAGARALVVAGSFPHPPYAPSQLLQEVEGEFGISLPSPREDFLVLLEDEDGSRPPAVSRRANPFEGAVVLVGPTGGLDQDFQLTPFDHLSSFFSYGSKTLRPRTPGVEVHAHAVRTLLLGSALKTPTGVDAMGAPRFRDRARGQLPLLGLLLLLCGGMGILMMRFLSRGSWVFLLVGLLVYQQVIFQRFYSARVWIHLVVPMLGVTITWVTILWYGYTVVERRRREIRAAFQHYLDPDIVRELENNPEALALGGKQQQVTCFFSDIESFSSFSEVMTPPELVTFINEYLTAMSDLLLKYGAWIDKFIGDAIVAVFNAPRDQPDHAFRCVLAALEMKQREAVLRQEWAARGLPQVKTRIGINTGPAIVGNVGTASKKDYTILGDAVNLAARLEALNKSYGTYLMIGENTYRAVQGRFDMRELDLVRVKGKKVPAAVYLVAALRGEASAGFLQSGEDWERAVEAYRSQRFEVAQEHFRAVLKRLPEDGPAKMYLERIEFLKKMPPPADWDGVWTMEHK